VFPLRKWPFSEGHLFGKWDLRREEVTLEKDSDWTLRSGERGGGVEFTEKRGVTSLKKKKINEKPTAENWLTSRGGEEVRVPRQKPEGKLHYLLFLVGGRAFERLKRNFLFPFK